MVSYESLVKKFGKSEEGKPFCMLDPDDPESKCKCYEGRGSRLNGRRTIMCTQGANPDRSGIFGGGVFGEVTQYEAKKCLSKKREEKAQKDKTPPGG